VYEVSRDLVETRFQVERHADGVECVGEGVRASGSRGQPGKAGLCQPGPDAALSESRSHDESGQVPALGCDVWRRVRRGREVPDLPEADRFSCEYRRQDQSAAFLGALLEQVPKRALVRLDVAPVAFGGDSGQGGKVAGDRFADLEAIGRAQRRRQVGARIEFAEFHHAPGYALSLTEQEVSLTAFGSRMRAHWALDPRITYLNHGTVGAPPLRVLAAQQAIRDEIERQPARFLLRELASVAVGMPRAEPPRMRVAAGAVAEFVGARGEDLVFVDNATSGVNAVLRSLDLREGDEIVIPDHAYGAVANVAAFVARERRGVVRTVRLPYPPADPRATVRAFADALGPRTRIAIVDHITSESALILPLAEIAALCRGRGVPLLADGAHAPGVLPLTIPSLGVDWYVGNLHKWAYAPRSCGFLWAPPERQHGLHPPVISWGMDLGFAEEFDWMGTRDPSPWLAAPEGIAMMSELGFEEIRRYNHDLAWGAARMLSERWGTRLPMGEAMVGAMATLPLPERCGSTKEDAARLRDALLFEDRIEVQLHSWSDRLWVRVSAQIYNEMADYERLAAAIAA